MYELDVVLTKQALCGEGMCSSLYCNSGGGGFETGREWLAEGRPVSSRQSQTGEGLTHAQLVLCHNAVERFEFMVVQKCKFGNKTKRK